MIEPERDGTLRTGQRLPTHMDGRRLTRRSTPRTCATWTVWDIGTVGTGPVHAGTTQRHGRWHSTEALLDRSYLDYSIEEVLSHPFGWVARIVLAVWPG